MVEKREADVLTLWVVGAIVVCIAVVLLWRSYVF